VVNAMPPDYDMKIKDLLSVPGKALRAKKIIILSLFIIIAMMLYNGFGHLAELIGNPDRNDIISGQFFIPLKIISFDSIPAQIIFYLGSILAIFAIMIGFMAVAKIDFEEICVNRFFSLFDSMKFARGRIKQLFLSEAAIVIFIGFNVLLGIIVGLISRIPILGPIVYSLFFLFPNSLIASFTIVIGMVLVLSVLVMPIAVANDYQKECFNSILETFSTILRRPFSWTFLTAASIIVAKIAGFIFGYISFRALQFMQISTGLGGGDKIKELISSGLNHLPFGGSMTHLVTDLFPGIKFGYDITPLTTYGVDNSIAGYIMAVSLILIFVVIWAYMLSVVATAQAHTFLLIKRSRGESIDFIEKQNK
jgi:hypothetical protein